MFIIKWFIKWLLSLSWGRSSVLITAIPPLYTAPPGFAHENIRKHFKGLKVPLVPKSEQLRNPPPSSVFDASQKGGYLVRRPDVIAALEAAGNDAAADFWRRATGVGHYFIFPKNVCRRAW